MTIAISIKVNDGVILASDSASSLLERNPQTKRVGVLKVYENANKIFNLRKGLPVGAITWGSGSIGQASISTLAKDFRKLITDGNLEINVNDYQVKDVAVKFTNFIKEKYNKEFEDWESNKPSLGFKIVGYSSKSAFPEVWDIHFEQNSGTCVGPNQTQKAKETGIDWNGEIEPLTRLILGISRNTANILASEGLQQEQIDSIINKMKRNCSANMAIPAMPIQDAIDLADYLVDVAKNYSKYTPGPPTVGGQNEIVAITKHEGFKWIKRKHYFNRKLNPNWEG